MPPWTDHHTHCFADIDQDITPADRVKADKMIAIELSSEPHEAIHPLIPPEPIANFSVMIQAELERKARGQKMEGGIDLSRYEAPEAPVGENVNDPDAWKTALRKAYASNTYLSGRHVNLSLLDDLGKNAWLIGNSQLEEILRSLEKELADLKEETDNVNKMRKAAQEGSRGEIVNLEGTWKRGVGKVLEVQIATENLRREILERQRQGAR